MPEVEEAAVVGVPDKDFSQAGVIIYVLRRDQALDQETVLAQLRPLLDNYKIPKRVYSVESLPRDAMEKIQKNLLREIILRHVSEAMNISSALACGGQASHQSRRINGKG